MTVREAVPYWMPETERERYLPEGPRFVRWDRGDQLVGVSIQHGADERFGSVWRISATDPSDNRVDYLFRDGRPTGRPGFVLPTVRAGELLVGMEQELRIKNWDAEDWSEPLATLPGAHQRAMVNDGEVVPGGEAVVFGTKDPLFRDPIAALYLYTVADRRITELRGGQTCSNGKIITRRDDGSFTLLDIDTPTRRVQRYRLDVAARTLTDEGVAPNLADAPGFPDGMCDAGDGTAIIAFYNPEPAPYGVARRYDFSTGQVLDEWRTPGSPRVTCPCLIPGANGGVDLVLTTCHEGMPAEQRKLCPQAGALFRVPTGLVTMPFVEHVQ